jgi:hypothetical protein
MTVLGPLRPGTCKAASAAGHADVKVAAGSRPARGAPALHAPPGHGVTGIDMARQAGALAG